MSAHTPGPWAAVRTPASGYFDWHVHAKSGPGRLMQIGIDTDNTEADARLIAAAPDLLAALERLLACYSVSHSPDARQSCWDQARAAIAAAKEQA